MVINANDEEPVFTAQEYEAMVMENSGEGTPVISLQATDADLGKDLYGQDLFFWFFKLVMIGLYYIVSIDEMREKFNSGVGLSTLV